MNRRVERQIIDKWIDTNCPDGISKLALESQVSSSLIGKIRLGAVPKKQGTRNRLCRALGVSEDELFPISPDRKKQAS